MADLQELIAEVKKTNKRLRNIQSNVTIIGLFLIVYIIASIIW